MSDTRKAVAITPETTLAALIEAYPDLEAVLAEAIPSFGRLKTAVLRRVVAGTLTLEQAAQTSGIRLSDLVRKLREAAGIPEEAATAAGLSGAPAWVKNGRIVKTLDARPLLAQGQHPKTAVMKELAALQKGEVFLLITPFVPGPLIEIGRAEGVQTWTRQSDSGRFETYFGR